MLSLKVKEGLEASEVRLFLRLKDTTLKLLCVFWVESLRWRSYAHKAVGLILLVVLNLLLIEVNARNHAEPDLVVP